MRLQYEVLCEKGRRSNNQDAVLECVIDQQGGIYLFAVADGMGGYKGGEIASKAVLHAFETYILKKIREDSAVDVVTMLHNAVITANESIQQRVGETPDLSGMGTTLTAIFIRDNRYWVINVGDSRTYRITRDNAIQLTKDHSFIQDYRDEHDGEIDEGIIGKYGHYLTKTLRGEEVEPDIFPTNEDGYLLESGEVFLLCSDGLIADKTDSASTSLQMIVSSTRTLQDALQNLYRYALNIGSTDNVSIILVEIGRMPRRKMRRNHTKKIVVSAIGLVVMLLSVLGWFLYKHFHVHTDMGNGSEVIVDYPADSSENSPFDEAESSLDAEIYFTGISEYKGQRFQREKDVLLYWQTEPEYQGVFRITISDVKTMNSSHTLEVDTGKSQYILEPQKVPINSKTDVIYWQVSIMRGDTVLKQTDIQEIHFIAE